ncbi:MAG: TolC family protein [Spirochaetia bacterium]|nr:TolC family protein [Spirochaetia bacterium]
MKSNQPLSAITLMVAYSGALAAAAPIALDSQLRKILEQHPRIQSQEFMISSRRNATRKLRFDYPDPELQVARSHGREDDVTLANPMIDRRSIRGTETQITQPIPFPGKGQVQAGAMEAGTVAERIRLDQLRNRLASEYITQLFQINILERQATFSREVYARLQVFERTTTVRYETGKASLIDLSMVRLRMASARLAIDQAESERLALLRSSGYFTQAVASNQRRSFSPDELSSLLAIIDERVSNSAGQIQTRSLDVALARAEERASDSADTLARMQYLPDFSVFAGYNKGTRRSVTYQQSMDERVYRAGVTIRIPLWSALTNHWEVADKADQLKSNHLRVEDAKQKAQSELDASLQRMEGIKKNLKLHQSELIPGVHMAQNAAVISYASGKGDFASVIQSLEQHFEHQINALRMEIDLNLELLKAAENLNVIFADSAEADHE